MFIVDSKYDTLEIVREAFVKSCLVGQKNYPNRRDKVDISDHGLDTLCPPSLRAIHLERRRGKNKEEEKIRRMKE